MSVLINGTNGLIQAYDYQVLTTGFSYTFAAGTQTLVINPAGTLATGTITMPASPSDGMTITFSSTKQITALTLNGNTGQTIIGGITSMAPNQAVAFIYRSASTTWLPMTTQVAQATGPAFSAYLGTNQTLSSTTWTKLSINTEEFDTNSNYDNATNYRFTPTVAGYYQFSCSVAALNSANTAVEAAFYKNGSAVKTAYNYAGSANILDDWGVNFSALIYMNGSTDYVELYALLVGGGLIVNSGSSVTWFSAFLARSA